MELDVTPSSTPSEVSNESLNLTVSVTTRSSSTADKLSTPASDTRDSNAEETDKSLESKSEIKDQISSDAALDPSGVISSPLNVIPTTARTSSLDDPNPTLQETSTSIPDNACNNHHTTASLDLARQQYQKASNPENSKSPEPTLMEHPSPDDILSLIPSKMQQGFRSVAVSLTSIDSDGCHILFGTNVGCGFLYNREIGALTKILSESRSDVISTVKLLVGIECQTALGTADGKITMVIFSNTATTSTRQVQKFSLGKIHESEITCMEWSQNGMKLFSGDKSGNIYQSERDFEKNSCNVSLVHTEGEAIVDISYRHMILLVSTMERTLLFHTNRKQDFLKPVGSKSRQGFFGACFTPDSVSSSDLQVFCTRPGFRIWISNVEGKVTNTLLLKDLVSSPHPNIKMENQLADVDKKDQQFRKILFFKNKYLLAYSDTSVFIIDPSKPSIVSSNEELSDILDVAITSDEIFILRKGREFHRLSERSDEIAIKRKRLAEEEKKKEGQSLNLQDVKDSLSGVQKNLTPIFGALQSRMSSLNEGAGQWTQKLQSQAKFLQKKIPLFSREEKHAIPLLDVKEGSSASPQVEDIDEQSSCENATTVQNNSTIHQEIEVSGNDHERSLLSPSHSKSEAKDSSSNQEVFSAMDSEHPSLDPVISVNKKMHELKSSEQDFLHSQGDTEQLQSQEIKDPHPPVNFRFEKLEKISTEEGGSIVFVSKRKKKSRTVSASSGKQQQAVSDFAKPESSTQRGNLTSDLHSSRTDINDDTKCESSEIKVQETTEPQQQVMIMGKTAGNQLCPNIIESSDLVGVEIPHSSQNLPENSASLPSCYLEDNDDHSESPKRPLTPVFTPRSQQIIGEGISPARTQDPTHKSPLSVVPAGESNNPLLPSESWTLPNTHARNLSPGKQGIDVFESMSCAKTGADRQSQMHYATEIKPPMTQSPKEELPDQDPPVYRSNSQPGDHGGLPKHHIPIKTPLKVFPRKKTNFPAGADCEPCQNTSPSKLNLDKNISRKKPLFSDSDEDVALEKASRDLEKFESNVPSSPDDIYRVDSSRNDFGSEMDSDSDVEGSEKQIAPIRHKSRASQGFINTMLNEIVTSVPVKLLDGWSTSELPHQVARISGSDSYIWYIDTMSNIYLTEQCGRKWMKLSKRGVQLCISPSGAVAWLLSKSGKVYAAVMPVELHLMEEPAKINWQLVGSNVSHAALGHDSAWVVTTNGSIKAQFGISRSYPYSKTWTLMTWNKGKIADLIATKSTVWCRTDLGDIFCAQIASIDSTDFKWEEVEVPPNSDGSASFFQTMTADSGNVLFLTDNRGILWFVTEDRKWWQVNVSEYIDEDSYSFVQSLHLPTTVTTSVYKVQRWMSGLIRAQRVAVNNQSIWIVHDKYKTTIARGPLTGQRWDITTPLGVSKSSKWKQLTTSSVFSPQHGSWIGLVWASRPNDEIFCFPSQDVTTAHPVTLAPPVFNKTSIICMSACKEALWVLFDDGSIYIRSGISADCIQGTDWSKLDTTEQLGDVKIIHLSCGTQNVWAVDSNGEVYFRIGIMSVDRNSLPPAWIPIDGCHISGHYFTQIECGLSDGSIWALDNFSDVYVRTGVSFNLPVGNGWEIVPGSHAQQLCISNHTVWGLRTGGNIIRRFGISERNGMGDYWKKIRGKFKKIAVTPYDELWAIDNEENLRHQCTTVYCPLVVEAQYKYDSTNVDFSSSQNADKDWEFL